jgi:hypothetical protein
MISPTAITFTLDGEPLGDFSGASKLKQLPIDSKYLTPDQFPFMLVPETARGYAFSSFFGFKVFADTTKVQVRKPKQQVGA